MSRVSNCYHTVNYVSCWSSLYNVSGLHEPFVTTTLTSPNGRTSTVHDSEHTHNQRGGFRAIAETTLLWDWIDTGIYTVTSDHYTTCPFLDFGSTGSNFPIGITYIAMQLAIQPPTPAGYLYEKVQPCNVYCNAPLTNRYPGPPVSYIQLQIPYGPFGCSLIVRVVRNTQAGICYDVGYN